MSGPRRSKAGATQQYSTGRNLEQVGDLERGKPSFGLATRCRLAKRTHEIFAKVMSGRGHEGALDGPRKENLEEEQAQEGNGRCVG
jgi:hypothetical protein